MKKKVLLIFLTLFLVGCAKETKAEEIQEEMQQDNRIKVTEKGFNHVIYVDTETGVAYLKCYQAGVCVMVDAEGNPLIYNPTE